MTPRRARAAALALALSACGTTRLYSGPQRDPQAVARVFATAPYSRQCESAWLEQVDGAETRRVLYVPDVVELEPGEHRLVYRVMYSGTGPRLEPQGYTDAKGIDPDDLETRCGQMYAYDVDVTVSVRAGYSYVPALEMKGGPGPFEYQRLCLTSEPDAQAGDPWSLAGRVRDPSPEAETLLCERGVFASQWSD